jgi:thiosulfate/3-mercaptopyruvate sulfurtransferase
MYNTLIDAENLYQNFNNDWVIVDCRFDLMNTDAGRNAYEVGHIPGAVYAHLSSDLSGPPVTDCGRHPMPTPEAMRDLFSRLGIGRNTQVVVYDNMSGAFAGRLWWMLRYMGHQAVAVLDGGFPAWQKAELPEEMTVNINQKQVFSGESQSDRLVLVDDVPSINLLIDSRDPARYRGDSEPLDRAAGHIPGALNHFWQNNIDADGFFLPVDTLKDKLSRLMGEIPSEQAVFYCGSGVTACHNLLAVAHAGLELPRLYAGSWSEWSSDESRPVATGNE